MLSALALAAPVLLLVGLLAGEEVLGSLAFGWDVLVDVDDADGRPVIGHQDSRHEGREVGVWFWYVGAPECLSSGEDAVPASAVDALLDHRVVVPARGVGDLVPDLLAGVPAVE